VRDIRPRHLREWLLGLIRWMEREGRAPKTVHDVHRALSSLFEMAVADEIIEVNPAKNQHVRELLPPLDPNAGGEAYTPDEVWAFLTDPRVPLDRQMLNAGQALAGMRTGESAGRRRGNINWDAPILPSMLINTQYQDALLKSARGANRKPRLTPMHPAYTRITTGWCDGGYESIYGCEMPADGFLVPDRRDPSRARTRNQLLSAHRRDCKALGIEHKGTHAFRRYFSTFSVADGADEAMIERITHNPRGSVLRRHYIVDEHLWGQLCEAVLCLKVDLSRGQVLSIEGRHEL
jgi:integrase